MTTPLSSITRAQWRTLSDRQVASLCGCSKWTANRYRRSHSIPQPVKQTRGRPRTINWSGFDITKTNRQNAAALGCTPQMAGRIRRQLLAEDIC